MFIQYLAPGLGPDQTFDERPPKFHFIISLTEHPNFEKISQNFTPLNYFNPKYEIEIFLEIWALSCFNRRRACCSSALWLPGSGQPALNADRCRIGSQRARTRAQRLQKSTAVRKQRVRPRSTVQSKKRSPVPSLYPDFVGTTAGDYRFGSLLERDKFAACMGARGAGGGIRAGGRAVW